MCCHRIWQCSCCSHLYFPSVTTGLVLLKSLGELHFLVIGFWLTVQTLQQALRYYRVIIREFLHISVLCLPFQNIIYTLKSICISVLVRKSSFISCPVNRRRHSLIHGSRSFACTNESIRSDRAMEHCQVHLSASPPPLWLIWKTLKYLLRVNIVSIHSGTILVNAEVIVEVPIQSRCLVFNQTYPY